MGVAFEWNPEWTQDEYHGTVREGWDYWISVSPDGSAPGSYIRLAFGERGLHGGACIYDLESLTADLSKAGFRRKVVLPPPLPRTWIFNKRVHETGIGFDIRARVDFLDVMADPRRECITDFSIGSGVIRHE
jgi:hypothetical protein